MAAQDPNSKIPSAENERQMKELEDSLAKGANPSLQELERFKALAALRDVSSPSEKYRPRTVELILLITVIVVLLTLTYFHVPLTSTELTIRATSVALDLPPKRSSLVIPGEIGDVVALRSARISGVEQVDPPEASDGDVIELGEVQSPRETTSGILAHRLQELSVPSDGSFRLTAAVAYHLGTRGIVLGTEGANLTTARFNEIYPVSRKLSESTEYIFRRITAVGKALTLTLFPLDTQRAFTVLRNVSLLSVQFDESGRSAILGGTIIIKDSPEPMVTVQSGDHIEVHSNRPMLVREVTFSEKGEFTAIISAPEADTIEVGTNLRDLRPTIFDWLRARWPTQVYATLSAIILLWVAVRSWWGKPS